MLLSGHFKELIAGLPSSYEANPAMFDHFIDVFGTHFWAKGKFGGFAFYRAAVVNEFLYKRTEESLRTDLTASYYAVSGKLSGEVSSASASAEFNSSAKVDFKVLGGNFAMGKIQDSAYIDAWQLSVLGNPWIFGGELSPIESLIANETLRMEMKKAVSVRRARLFLQDLKDSLNLGQIDIPSKEREKLEAIETLLAIPTASSSELTKVLGEIDGLFAVLQEFRGKLPPLQVSSPIALN